MSLLPFEVLVRVAGGRTLKFIRFAKSLIAAFDSALRMAQREGVELVYVIPAPADPRAVAPAPVPQPPLERLVF